MNSGLPTYKAGALSHTSSPTLNILLTAGSLEFLTLQIHYYNNRDNQNGKMSSHGTSV
jgi:hypothetical protein